MPCHTSLDGARCSASLKVPLSYTNHWPQFERWDGQSSITTSMISISISNTAHKIARRDLSAQAPPKTIKAEERSVLTNPLPSRAKADATNPTPQALIIVSNFIDKIRKLYLPSLRVEDDPLNSMLGTKYGRHEVQCPTRSTEGGFTAG